MSSNYEQQKSGFGASAARCETLTLLGTQGHVSRHVTKLTVALYLREPEKERSRLFYIPHYEILESINSGHSWFYSVM